MGDVVLQHFSHEHPLVLFNHELAKDAKFVCYGCQQPIITNTGSPALFYCCNKCNYFLHKKCGELPQAIKHPKHPQHYLTLVSGLPPGYMHMCCDVCRVDDNWKSFTYHCSECHFDAHVSCTPLEERPKEHKFHDHPLNFTQRPSSFFCDACGTEGEDLSYRCSNTSCEFLIHDKCASSENTIKRDDHNHPLQLSYSIPYSKRKFHHTCYICEKVVHPNYWVYYCASCTYFAHLKCCTSQEDEPLRATSEQQLCLCRHFPLGEILLATNNFDDTLVIGQGGFGKVYKGIINNGAVTVAIKRLNPMSKQGAPQFWTEVELLSRFRHSHLVSLIGYCNIRNEMILVYEYMPRGSLADHLYKTQSNGSTNLSWILRLKICIGAAQGLDYLHTGTGINDRVIHRDMKSSNILLDDSWAAKVSDFGLSKIGPANQNLTHVSTNVKGTFGYFDPEYMTTHRLTRKSDVYSFGVVLLEVLSGKRAMDPKVCEEHWDLAGWAKECIRRKEVEQIIDPYLKHEILPNSLKEYVQMAEKCLLYRSKKRPTMAEVVASLEHALALQERIDSSMLAEDFMNLGWAASDNQENPDDSTEINDDSGNGRVIEDEVIDDVVLSRNSQSHVRPSRITPFKRMARFLLGKPRLSSVNETSNLEAVNETSNLEAVNETSNSEYDFDTLKAATDNFSIINQIGEGESGVVYKGWLPDGRTIAVKKLSSDILRVESEFRKEISLMLKLQHRNLVSLLGFCLKGTERFLVYPFFVNSNLDNFINVSIRGAHLDNWEQCLKIIKGVSKGILYLHEDSPVRIIHRDLRPSHILFDEEMTPKISSFGLAKPLDGGDSGLSLTYMCGPFGYIAPEYYRANRLSVKSDVFSFGILVLNIISGRRASFINSEGTSVLLHDYAMRNWREGTYWDILIHPHLSLSGSEVREEIKRCLHIALLCIQENEVERPTMSSVLLMLNNPALSLPEPSRWSYVDALSTSMRTTYIDDMHTYNDDMHNYNDDNHNYNGSVNEDSSSELSPR